jgi:hypothetical protein
MKNPKKNSVLVHEDFEKWPIRLLEKTTLNHFDSNLDKKIHENYFNVNWCINGGE